MFLKLSKISGWYRFLIVSSAVWIIFAMINIHPWIIYGIRGGKAPTRRVRTPVVRVRTPVVRVRTPVVRVRTPVVRVRTPVVRVRGQASAGTNWDDFLAVGIMPIILLWGIIWIVRGVRKNSKT